LSWPALRSLARNSEHPRILDEWVLGDNPYVCGKDMTIADIFGAQLVSCGELVKVDLEARPNVERWMAAMKDLSEWKEVNEVHDGFAASLAGKEFISA
jgi:glutathione S-transferase